MCKQSNSVKYGLILKFFQLKDKMLVMIQELKVGAIDFEVSFSDSKISSAFCAINKFFKKVISNEEIVLVSTKDIITKCITGSFKERDKVVSFITPSVDLDEHD
jgi:hypothetical protein